MEPKWYLELGWDYSGSDIVGPFDTQAAALASIDRDLRHDHMRLIKVEDNILHYIAQNNGSGWYLLLSPSPALPGAE